MTQEELWFDHPTWNHDRGTTEVIIVFKKKVPIKAVYPVISEYLKSIGLKSFSEVSTNTHSILVNLVDKEYKLLNYIENKHLISRHTPLAVPSQLEPYMKANVGMLTGKRFGL
jgi:hypothetical protein